MASTRDLVYAWITEQIDNGIDFTDKQARIESRKKFLLAHPDQKGPTVEAAWSKVLTRVARERKIAITQVKQPKRAPKEYDTAELDPQGSPEPVDVEPGRISIGAGPRQKQQQGQGQGQQQGQQQQGQGQEQRGTYEQWERRTYTARAVGMFFNGLYMGINAVVPDAEPLTNAEIETLGELWVEHFNILLNERPRLSIIMALGGTLGLLAGKIIEGRRRQKKREAAEQTVNKTKDKAKRSAQQGQEQEGGPHDAREAGFTDAGSSTTYETGEAAQAAQAEPETEVGFDAHPRATARNRIKPKKEGDE